GRAPGRRRRRSLPGGGHPHRGVKTAASPPGKAGRGRFLPGGLSRQGWACPGGAVCVILDGDGAADARPFCTWAAHTGRNHAMSLLVVDGNSIANRAFFGIKVLTTKE